MVLERLPVWKRLTGKNREETKPTAAPEIPVARLPTGVRTYAIGDIHGRADLLDEIARKIEADLKAQPVANARSVFLGDYIDRGPHSSRVLDRLAGLDF